jgi:hypothetical protein
MDTFPKLTPAHWDMIKAHYHGRCVYCGKSSRSLTKDHVTPRAARGPTTMSNIVPACQSCNSRKRDGLPLIPVQPLLALCDEADWQHLAGAETPRRGHRGNAWYRRAWARVILQQIKALQARISQHHALTAAVIKPTRPRPQEPKPSTGIPIPLPRSSLERHIHDRLGAMLTLVNCHPSSHVNLDKKRSNRNATHD